LVHENLADHKAINVERHVVPLCLVFSICHGRLDQPLNQAGRLLPRKLEHLECLANVSATDEIGNKPSFPWRNAREAEYCLRFHL
jgi:hypothetical protein